MRFLLFSLMVLTLGTLISTATAFNCSYLVHNLTTTAGATAGFPNLTHIARATKAAQKASPTTAAVFATSTAIKPNPVASGTTKKCGKYYQVQSGDFCQVIALKQKIDLELFEAINPQINKDCTNLFLGYYYCVSPTADWNSAATTNPKIVTAPTITPKGTTDKCYEYYVVKSGDFCAKVEDLFSITFAQLQFWNPDLKTDCSNLLLGEAYCINGAVKAKRADGGMRVGFGSRNRRSVRYIDEIRI